MSYSPLFTLSGRVQHHMGRGRQLGYPTANIVVFDDTPEGIFTAITTLENGEDLPSLLFVGSSLTFGETEKKGEVYILNFSRSIYGQKISVKVYEKLRDNKKFNSAKDLIAQMNLDEKAARAFFKKMK